MNLKRLRRVLRRLWFFHVNIKYRLNREMEEKGIVARDCCPGLSSAGAPVPAARRAPVGDNPPLSPPCRSSQFLLHGQNNPQYESRCSGNIRDFREPNTV